MKNLNLALLMLLAFTLASCKTMGGLVISDHHGSSQHEPRHSDNHMPPAHAPAHGRRAKASAHNYYYYPDSYVYFDINRSVYFYLSGSNWLVSATLPSHYHLDNYRVSIKMDSAKPYSKYKHHKKKYPKKKKNKRKNKHKKNKKHY